jgi:hypothetical protein
MTKKEMPSIVGNTIWLKIVLFWEKYFFDSRTFKYFSHQKTKRYTFECENERLLGTKRNDETDKITIKEKLATPF